MIHNRKLYPWGRRLPCPLRYVRHHRFKQPDRLRIGAERSQDVHFLTYWIGPEQHLQGDTFPSVEVPIKRQGDMPVWQSALGWCDDHLRHTLHPAPFPQISQPTNELTKRRVGVDVKLQLIDCRIDHS